ncbi:hypothetical protein BU52_32020 [Streptomyces toyocaensis]|uniref:Uncharacterized protein n=1 Tax=Streptomyces toyocaensis TaxID=55952 RepID=A0A081XHY1_STRTO|nr:hypothetical protein [Streptomyces toyocaensis]KES03154.1 hypothetical protein BU52_32020 [Streptomyces toyocaensis]
MHISNPDKAGDVAGSHRSSWHQRASAYVAELQAELDRIEARGHLSDEAVRLLEKAEVQIDAARQALDAKETPMSLVTGSTVDRAWANIHRAELTLLKLAVEKDLTGWGTEVLARAKQHLGVEDPIRHALESRVDSNGRKFDARFKDLAVRALRAANDAQDLERSRLRSFRNILLTSVVITSVIAALLVVWGYADAQAIAGKLCFTSPGPDAERFCPIGGSPSGGDVLIVEFFGLCGAVLAGAVSLRKMQGTATPYMMPICLLLLRLPVGALAALFGLLIIQGGFIPGLSDLDSGAQILAWALVFGVAQESITRLIDAQGRKVMGNVRGPSRGFEEDAGEETVHLAKMPVGRGPLDGAPVKIHRKSGRRHVFNRSPG